MVAVFAVGIFGGFFRACTASARNANAFPVTNTEALIVTFINVSLLVRPSYYSGGIVSLIGLGALFGKPVSQRRAA